MNEWVAIISVLLVVIGLLGCFLPIIPGPPLAWAALLLLKWTHLADYSLTFLVVTALITIAVQLLDYFLPAWLTKMSGGSKAGQRGAIVGVIIGILLGNPVTLLLGPAIGALVGELIHDSRHLSKALKSGIFVFLGFLITTGIALIWTAVMGGYVVAALHQRGLFNI